MRQFDTLIQKYQMFMEADEAVAPEAEAPVAEEVPAEAQSAPETQPAPAPEVKLASPARAALIQIAVTAYIEPATNLSDTLVQNSDEINIKNVDSVLQDIQRRIPQYANRHFNKNFGKGPNTPVEPGEKVELAKLAWNAMFNKSEIEINQEIQKEFKDVTVENAEKAYNALSLALSYNSEKLD